jgi:four helix bundle protein
MSGMKSYKELDAWNVAMTMANTTYDLTDTFPERERYGLTAQLRKSAVSVPSNIAEGQARGTAGFGLFFIRIALGSVAELDTQMELARRRKYITADATRELDNQLERLRRMLYGMRREHNRRLGAVGAAVVSLVVLSWAAGLFA